MKKLSMKSKHVNKSSDNAAIDDNEEIIPELTTSTIFESLNSHAGNTDQTAAPHENATEETNDLMQLEVGDEAAGAVVGNKRKQPAVDKDKKLSRIKKSPLKKIIRTERDISFAALLEYGNRHGHCNVPIHETFECDLPGTENVEDNAAAPLVHYNDSLGAWLHDELSRLRNKKGAKAAKERQQFQELVDQGKLNQFDLDAEVQKETTHRESAAVRTSSAGEISNGEPKSKRVTVHIDWNLCYQALLHYKSKHGHCNIHQKAFYDCVLPGLGEGGTDYHYYGRLGRWLDNQRQFKKNGRLLGPKLALLQELVDQEFLYWDGADMSMAGLSRTSEGVDWNKHFAALLEYGKIHNSYNVPQKFVFECDIPMSVAVGFESSENTSAVYHYNGRLGRWLDNQRQFKKGNGGKLYNERNRKLQVLVDEGKMVWHSQGAGQRLSKGGSGAASSERKSRADPPNLARKREKRVTDESEWSKHYAALLVYLKDNPARYINPKLRFTCEIPNQTEEGGSSGMAAYTDGRLGQWCAAQRRLKKEKDRGDINMYTAHPHREAYIQALVDEGKFSWVMRNAPPSTAIDSTAAATATASAAAINEAVVIREVSTAVEELADINIKFEHDLIEGAN